MLGCFSVDHPNFSLSDLSDKLALPKPTVFRIASIMQGLGFLDKAVPSGDYTLGRANLRHADALLASIPIREFALPVMDWVRDQVNETVILSLREGDFRYNIDSVDCTHSIVQAQQIGTPIPLYAGAASRVMLAALPAHELKNYLRRVQLAAFSSTTITDIGELQARGGLAY
jgi:IclR family transcriptional regulator, KDG regulon repressor